MSHTTLLSDGSFDWSGGVDSSKVTTVQSDLTPNGLRRNQLAWLDNATVRGGGILQRTGWAFIFKLLQSGLVQSAYLYEPPDGSNPYLMVSITGLIYQALLDAPYTVTLLSTSAALANSFTSDYGYMVQAEQFLVIQSGDGVTLPLFWDGATLRRSLGLQKTVGVVAPAGFTVPAVGAAVNVPLTGPYTGGQNQIITIGAATYIQVVQTNYASLKNISEPSIGGTMPAAVVMYDASTGSPVGTVIAPFTIPALSASVNMFEILNTIGPFPLSVNINGNQWKVSPFLGPAPGVNHVFLVNLTDTPGGVIAGGNLLLSVPEIPAATAMDYYMGRLWYAQGRIYSAGDIVGGPSGTAFYNLRDSVLKLTENPLCIGGDGFTVPSNAGNIRALKHSANINTQLGQGSLFIFTRKTVYSLNVPVSRTDWIGADANNQPLQTVVQLVNGAVNDRSIVAVNGDLFYQSLDPAIRSLTVAVRNFQQWGNKPVSANEDRALQFTDRDKMRFCSGLQFQNRLFEGILPTLASDGINIVSQAIAVLDFDLISSFDTTLPPSWEGMYEGLQIIQMLAGDFGGRDRAFALVVSSVDNSIEVWELTNDQRYERPQGTGVGAAENRVSWYVEFPAFTWGHEFELKELSGGELWIDKIFGTVEMTVYYRPDADPCWKLWFATAFCAAKNCTETGLAGCGSYPLELREGYRFPITFPAPPEPCDSMGFRPATWAYQQQVRIVLKGWVRIRGLILFAHAKNRSEYEGMSCA